MKPPKNVGESTWTPVISPFQQLLFQRLVKNILSCVTKNLGKELYSYEWKKKIIDFPPLSFPLFSPNGGIPETNVFPGEGGTSFFIFESVGSFE